MKIHKEGYTILAVILTVLLAINLALYLVAGPIGFYIVLGPSLLFYLFILRFFREPSRPLSINESSIYSPADGTVVAIEEVEEDEFLKIRCIQVSVFMSVWNVHINWFPFGGTVRYFKYHPGLYLLAWHPKSSTHNERTSIAVERSDGVLVLMRQIAGAVARRIVCYARENETVGPCTQMGFIKFGSRVDLFLPLDAKIKVALDQKVVGTQTVIAEIPLKQ